ncbi:hypothetical protein ACLOJK_002644 [Asimina triloba]
MSVSLTVMTFNLHEDQPSDSPNSWEKRRDLCISVITSYSPIILCTQQGLLNFLAGEVIYDLEAGFLVMWEALTVEWIDSLAKDYIEARFSAFVLYQALW